MKNIKNSDIKEAIKITDCNNNTLFLVCGEKVKIKTDNTDFKQYYEGVISFISIDGLSIDERESVYDELILFEYIEDIKII